jgi:crossover junction endodeoxyribonuclease RuvC
VTRLLALDLGTKTGWAVSPIESGVWNLASRRFEGGGMRYLRFRQHLTEALQGVTAVYFEEVRRHLGVDAAHIYGGLLAILSEECERRNIPYSGVPVGSIKRHATGKGNADKEKMLTFARARWGKIVTDDNHADALWILDYVQNGGGA